MAKKKVTAAPKPPRTPGGSRTRRNPTSAAVARSNSQEASDDESRRSGRASVVSNTSATTTASRDRLPRWQEKLLAQLLEGPVVQGIQNVGQGKRHKLETILDNFQNKRTEEPLVPFGHRGDEIRRKISQKHNKWKNLPRDKYLTKLGRLSVEPYEVASWKQRSTAESIEDESLSSASEESQEDHGDDFLTPEKPKAQSTRPIKSSSAKKSRRVPAEIHTSPTDELAKRLQTSAQISTPKQQNNLSSKMSSDNELSPGARAFARSLGKFL